MGVLRVGEGLGEKLSWWGHFRQGHDCWILKMSIGRSKVGRRQEWELRMLRVGNHLLLLLLLLLHVNPMHGLGRLLVALLQL